MFLLLCCSPGTTRIPKLQEQYNHILYSIMFLHRRRKEEQQWTGALLFMSGSVPNNPHAINFSMAPLLAGQVDTDISSLLETAETRCSNKTDLSGKSEMPQRKEKACCKQRSSPAVYVWAQSLVNSRPWRLKNSGLFHRSTQR